MYGSRALCAFCIAEFQSHGMCEAFERRDFQSHCVVLHARKSGICEVVAASVFARMLHLLVARFSTIRVPQYLRGLCKHGILFARNFMVTWYLQDFSFPRVEGTARALKAAKTPHKAVKSFRDAPEITFQESSVPNGPRHAHRNLQNLASTQSAFERTSDKHEGTSITGLYNAIEVPLTAQSAKAAPKHATAAKPEAQHAPTKARIVVTICHNRKRTGHSSKSNNSHRNCSTATVVAAIRISVVVHVILTVTSANRSTSYGNSTLSYCSVNSTNT